MQKKNNLIRIVENNNWVAFSLFFSILALVLTFIYLNREVSLKNFVIQKKEDSSNTFLTWLIVSLVFCVQISTLFSQYVPILPKAVENISLLGFSLNKFGYTFLVFCGFYIVKTIFTFFFYSSIHYQKSIVHIEFTASRLYFVGSILVMVLVFIHYYVEVDRAIFLRILVGIFAILFVFKNLSYLLSSKENLPTQWYYKLLYICTLQIAPIFALWRLIFF